MVSSRSLSAPNSAEDVVSTLTHTAPTAGDLTGNESLLPPLGIGSPLGRSHVTCGFGQQRGTVWGDAG